MVLETKLTLTGEAEAVAVAVALQWAGFLLKQQIPAPLELEAQVVLELALVVLVE